ncbi:probable ERG24 - C-14 sterol reductase [Melanopsichium pennsylvanicum]|uniref:Probable ERG24 - C-14 sterol reductase n=2 Tax=Melanopsichium pennsylvanicum TaxID=63383 RepID=A0AAJ4XP48_9BASI|nr:probable ERG24-C-14 sterol reductase [Melanopsichium pennsylvanicum 4]SNX85361.1 probable ERG24 - C-14 sterol reductase [Melanopsichium pennsylvanicum]
MVTTRAQSQIPRTAKSRVSFPADSANSTPAPATPTTAPHSILSRRSPIKKSSSSSFNTSSANASPAIRRRKSSVMSQKSLSKEQLGPKTTHYEFGGPLGAAFVSLTVPFFSYYLYFGCSEKLGCALTLPIDKPAALRSLFFQGVKDSLFDTTGWVLYATWYTFTVLAWIVLPGQDFQGTELRTGQRLHYKLNAFATFVVAMAASAGWIFYKGPEGFTIFYEHWPGLVSASLFNSFVQAVYCYLSSFGDGKLLALGGNSGNGLYDWFIGRELNPRIGSFDIKSFNELRPGLILWAILDISCACQQYIQLYGRVTDSMILVCLFHLWYVADALVMESAIFSTMDITTDGFGFMLSVGDLVWVPFVYSLQARYLAFRPVHLGIAGTAAIIGVNLIGYYIFRQANLEKNQFRNGTNPKNLKYMTTATGRKLLTSGWWGRSRHPNYLGDWIMAWAWSLPCGFATPIPYFYVAYFAVLLVHRQFRDDEACQKKYGKDWDKYCQLVRSRIIPGIY